MDSYMKVIDESIIELQSVQSEEKTFEEIYGISFEPIGISAGEFEYDKDVAYFISNNPEAEPNIEMPLQEVIDILIEWKEFLLS